MRAVDDWTAPTAFGRTSRRRRPRPPRRDAEEECAAIVDICREAGQPLPRNRSRWRARRSGDAAPRPRALGVETISASTSSSSPERTGHIIAPATRRPRRRSPNSSPRSKVSRPPELETLTRPPAVSFARSPGCRCCITGVNFGVARRVRSARPTRATVARQLAAGVHIAVRAWSAGANLAELTPLLRLLARSGTGQKLSTYTP